MKIVTKKQTKKNFKKPKFTNTRKIKTNTNRKTKKKEKLG